MLKRTIKSGLLIFILLAIFYARPSEAAGWVLQNSGTSSALYAIDMADYYNGLVVGSGGLILKTIDGGKTWTAVTSGVTVHLRSVYALNKDTAWVVGDNGTILKTTNGGTSWTPQTSGTTNTLWGIEFWGGYSGYAVGSNGTILKTTNGGSTWAQQNSNTQQTLFDVTIGAGSASIAWVVGDGKILKTTNGGLSWNSQSLNLSPLPILRSLVDLSDTILFAVGSPATVLKSIDGGVNWSDASPSDFLSTNLTSISTATGQSIFFVGGSRVDKSIDGGTNWTFDVLDMLGSLYGVKTKSSAIGWVVGSAGKIFKYDAELPTAPSTLTKTTPDNDSTPAFTWSAATDDITVPGFYESTGTGIAYYEYSLNGGAYINNGSDLTLTLSQSLTNGTHNLTVRAVDNAANAGTAVTLSFTVNTTPADAVAPTGSFSINNGADYTNSNAVTLSLSCSDNVGCSRMQVAADGAVDTEALEGYSASKNITLSSGDGTKTVAVKFSDNAGNASVQYADTIILDANSPIVGSLSPTSAQATVAQSFTVSYSDTIGVASCNLYVDSVDQGPMTLAGVTSGSASRTYSFSDTASHTLQARCADAAGNAGLGALTTVSVSAAPTIPVDTIAPSAPSGVQITSADSDATPTFTWSSAGDNVGTTNYLVQIDNGALVDVGGSLSYTASADLANGSHTIKILAKDAAGNTGSAASFIFTVNTSSPVTCSLLMKKAYKIPASKAVYYITTDCTKRPFKNGQTFFTYFDSWSEVIVTTQAILDSIPDDPLGFTPAGPKYDPKYGALVKIVTDPKVYLLLGTEKYWIISEAVFTGLNYDWKWIEDVDPDLLNKYTIGSEINYTDHHPNYTIIKYKGSPKVYRLEPDPEDYFQQVKRWIKNEKVFNALKFRWDRIVTVPDSEIYKDGKIMDESEVSL